jgi:hypothetical protein
MQPSHSARRSTVASGLLTGLSTLAVSGSAAVAGIVLARRFGRGEETDGFFAAYALYAVLVLVASALRVVVLPRMARARADGRLGRELGTWAAALAIPLLPAVVVAVAAPGALGDALAGGAGAGDAAAELLPWLVPAAAGQVLAGLAASALAALDDYGTAALGFAAGAIAGLVPILALPDEGVVVFGWGLALNGAIALGVPLAALLGRGALAVPGPDVGARLGRLAEGVALPVALQALYVIAYRYSVGLGPGEPTTFSYAYLVAALLVAVTATSFALVTSVPLTRAGLTPERAARHVVAASWLSLAVVAGAAGVFALAGERVVHAALGSAYGGETGAELGRLVVAFAPWMAVSIAISVAFPLLFVLGRTRSLPLVAVAALAAQALVLWPARELGELVGIALGTALTTGGVLAVLLHELGALGPALRGLAVASCACGGLALLAFAAPQALLDAAPAAAAGLLLYATALALWRPAGLRGAWAYARALR